MECDEQPKIIKRFEYTSRVYIANLRISYIISFLFICELGKAISKS